MCSQHALFQHLMLVDPFTVLTCRTLLCSDCPLALFYPLLFSLVHLLPQPEFQQRYHQQVMPGVLSFIDLTKYHKR